MICEKVRNENGEPVRTAGCAMRHFSPNRFRGWKKRRHQRGAAKGSRLGRRHKASCRHQKRVVTENLAAGLLAGSPSLSSGGGGGFELEDTHGVGNNGCCSGRHHRKTSPIYGDGQGTPAPVTLACVASCHHILDVNIWLGWVWQLGDTHNKESAIKGQDEQIACNTIASEQGEKNQQRKNN